MLRIQQLRKERGLSQQTLAQYLGVTQATLSGWENEKYEIDNKSLSACAAYFNVSVDYLLGHGTEYDELNHARKITKELQEKKQIPIAEIEEKLGVNYATFQSWYSGHGDYFNDKLFLIAQLFQVSTDYLLGREDTLDRNSELEEYLEELRTRPEMKMLFNLTKDATKEDVEKAVKIIEALLEK